MAASRPIQCRTGALPFVKHESSKPCFKNLLTSDFNRIIRSICEGGIKIETKRVSTDLPRNPFKRGEKKSNRGSVTMIMSRSCNGPSLFVPGSTQPCATSANDNQARRGAIALPPDARACCDKVDTGLSQKSMREEEDKSMLRCHESASGANGLLLQREGPHDTPLFRLYVLFAFQPRLCVFETASNADIVALWRGMGRDLNLPLRLALRDGTVENVTHAPGELSHARRRGSQLGYRRPRFLARRKPAFVAQAASCAQV
jgi:hypothetical protein